MFGNNQVSIQGSLALINLLLREVWSPPPPSIYIPSAPPSLPPSLPPSAVRQTPPPFPFPSLSLSLSPSPSLSLCLPPLPPLSPSPPPPPRLALPLYSLSNFRSSSPVVRLHSRKGDQSHPEAGSHTPSHLPSSAQWLRPRLLCNACFSRPRQCRNLTHASKVQHHDLHFLVTAPRASRPTGHGPAAQPAPHSCPTTRKQARRHPRPALATLL